MKSTRVVPSCFCLLLLVLLSRFPLFAQTITGAIAGDVTDSSGAVVPNATITVQNVGTDESRTATTTHTGSYRIPELPVGSYKVTATATGFKTLLTTAQIAPGGVTHADFKLQIGQRTETIEVQGTAPLVDTSPFNNNYLDSEKIENVPLNGRDFNSLLAITPGVQRAPGGGFLAISVNGSRTTSNNYFIDGLYNNDRYYGDSAINETGIVGIPATLFPPEAIEELSVQETPSAEFGVKGGAPINLVMKSGTNSWHGSGQWVRHTDFADADNYFANHAGCGTPGSCTPTPLRNQQFGGTLGGPIIKDKTFFFAYYEGQRYHSAPVSDRVVPSTAEVNAALADIAASGLTVDPVGQKLFSYFPTSATGTLPVVGLTTASANGFGVKIDHKLTPKHTISGRYIFGDSLQSAPPFAGLLPSSQYPADLFNSVAPSRAQMAGLSWTWQISNTKILESRLGYTRFAQILGPNNKIDPKSLGVDTGPLSPADFGVPYVYLSPLGYGGYIGGVQGYPLVTRPDQTWDWSEHFSWTKGNHTIKFGGNFQRGLTNGIRNNARTGLTFGYPTFTPPPGTGPGQDAVAGAIEQLLLGQANIANRNFGDTHRHIIQDSAGFYAQDDWKVKKGLTVTFGLRYEINGAIGETHNLASTFIPGQGLVKVGQGINALYNRDMTDFGPRAGFAWDLFGNGKTALRAGYSLTYDVPTFAAVDSPYSFAGVAVGAFSQPDLGVFPVRLVGGAANPPNTENCLQASQIIPPATVPDYICIDSALVGPIFGSNPQSGPVSIFSVRRDLKTPRYHNFNLSLQQEVAHNNVLTLGYSGQRGQRLLVPFDLNASPIGSPCGFDFSSCDSFRPLATTFPNYQHIIQLTNLANSQYDSMQASFEQRNWHGIDTRYNLTWSKCYDNNSVNRGGAGDYPQLNNPVNLRDSWGLCDHDVRLNFNVGGVYSFPRFRPLGHFIGDGWQLSSIYTALSGRPFSVLVGTAGPDPSGQGLDGNGIRAAWDGTPIHYNTRNPDNYVQETFLPFGTPGTDPCGRQTVDNTQSTFYFTDLPISPFYIPCPGQVGNSRRNQLIGPGLSQLDATIIKNTKVNERLTVQFRWEVYNVLNRANFYYKPNNTIGGGISSAFGLISVTPDVNVGNPVIAQGGPRNMNFVLKIMF